MFMTNYEMVYGKKSDRPVQPSYDTPVYPETDQSFYNNTQGLGAGSNNKSLNEGINLLRNGFTNLSGKVMDYAHSDDAKNKLEKIKTLSGNAINNVRNISEKAVDYARSDEAKNKLENVKEFSGDAVNNIKNLSGAVINDAKSGLASQLSDITPTERNQNKINAYFEDDDEEYEDNDILKSSMTIVESDERSIHIVPILIAVILILCAVMIVFLFSYRNLKTRSTIQMTDNSNNAEYVTAVVSETQKAVERNQEAEINEKSVTLSIKESDQFVEEINEVPQNSIKNLTKDEVYSRYIDIINSMDFYGPYRGFLVDLNDDNINELIVPDVDDMTYKLYYCDGTDVKSIKFGAFMALGSLSLYKVEGDNGKNYIYYRDNYGYKSEQGYFSLYDAAEINIYLKFPYEDEGTATWNVSYNKTSLFAEGSEYVYGLYGETKQCYAQILAAFQKYRFGISDNSNYVSINGLYYDELLDELRSYN